MSPWCLRYNGLQRGTATSQNRRWSSNDSLAVPPARWNGLYPWWLYPWWLAKKQFLEGYLRPCKLESQFLLSWRTKPSISPKRNHHDWNWLIYGQSIYECGMVSLSRAFSSFSQWTSLPKCSMNMNVFTNDHVLWTNPPNVGNYGAYGFIL